MSSFERIILSRLYLFCSRVHNTTERQDVLWGRNCQLRMYCSWW